ncbi:MAG: 16S rRNA (cytosine(967)-C(5))-methyltransferase RsmB [Acidobacteria bacterium]|nr:16S rRNA (cytosine(967)-C(5))-methyltransferase RsmB [Acidobacteriota bacterium]
MIGPARIAAYHALRAIADGRCDLPTALARSRDHLDDDRDRALAAEIVAGSLRHQRSIDHLIEHFARRAIHKLDTDVLHVLRLSLYQILHLDRIPASAAVDDAVNLVRQARKPSATGFVNAVLRATLRQRRRLPLPPRPDVEDRTAAETSAPDRAAAMAYLGVTHSHPDWLVARWYDRYGFDACERWVAFNNETPKMTLRANTVISDRDSVASELRAAGVDTVPAPHAPDGLIVVGGNPLRADLSAAGSPASTFFVQDEASQLVSLAVAARPGERILDLCASPGGKALAMAGDMRDTGLLVACDVRARRVELLAETVRASGARCVRVAHVAANGPLPFGPVFDRVLVDAPCSGLGTIRHDPDIRWRRREDDLARFALDQRHLLDRAATLVRPGGRLVYATCSSEPDENDAIVDAFLSTHDNFALIDLRADASPHLCPVLDARGLLRTLPCAHALEAFFAAALIRTSAG